MTKSKMMWDFWSIVIAFSFFGLITRYIAELRYIPSGSMLPELQINDRLIIEKLTYRKRNPLHGEIVVFNSPAAFDSKLIQMRTRPLPNSLECTFRTFPLLAWIPNLRDPACDAYIKRVVAVEGDYVVVDSRGKLLLNGSLIKEPYVENFCGEYQAGFNGCKPFRGVVPNEHVFVLGDNRRNSWDGRFWPGSFLPVEEVIGRASWRYWPFKRYGPTY